MRQLLHLHYFYFIYNWTIRSLKKGILGINHNITRSCSYRFPLRSIQRFERVKMFSEDKQSPQGYLMSIGGALAGLSATMFMPINPIGMILWVIGSVSCCIGAIWYDKTHEDQIYGHLVRIFFTVVVFVILNFFYNVVFL